MGQLNAERCTSTGTIKGCGYRARWDRHGKPVVVLYAIAESDGERVWTCADCIARAGAAVPDTVPARCRCDCPGCERPRSSVTNYWRLCSAECHEKLRKIVDDREAERAHASGALALEPGIKRESSADTSAAHKETRKEAECALLGCGRPARIYHCYREPYTTARKFFCSAGHLQGYATTAKLAAEQTDGAVQAEVTDSLQAIEALTKIPKPPSPAARLVLERAAKWAERAAKWHARLERERAWSAHGRVLSVLTGAASTISAATVAPHYAAGVVGALMVATALIAWRGQVAQARLDSARLADAWVSAERIAELYRGLVVELDAVITTCDDFMRCETAEQVLVKSQQLEAKARFGVPEGLRSVLVEVCK